MKNKSRVQKVLLLFLTLALVLCLAGCNDGSTTNVPDNNNTASNNSESEQQTDNNSEREQLDVGSTLPPDNNNAEVDQESLQELVSIMGETAANFRIGVAGSSLVAAEYAGKILDWEAEADNTVATAAAATQEFNNTLNSDEAAKFSKQMQKIYEAAQQLCSDNGADLLQSCGYEAQFYPWDQQDMQALFTAILDVLN